MTDSSKCLLISPFIFNGTQKIGSFHMHQKWILEAFGNYNLAKFSYYLGQQKSWDLSMLMTGARGFIEKKIVLVFRKPYFIWQWNLNFSKYCITAMPWNHSSDPKMEYLEIIDYQQDCVEEISSFFQ